MNSARNTIDGYRQCTDDDLDCLRALIAADVPQWQASLHLWGPRRTVSDRLPARLHDAGRADWSLPVARGLSAGRGRGRGRGVAVSERMTSATAPGVTGVADYGRKTRAEMVAQFRAYYRQQRAEAEAALAVPDEDIVVETYLGPWVMRNREVVTQ